MNWKIVCTVVLCVFVFTGSGVSGQASDSYHCVRDYPTCSGNGDGSGNGNGCQTDGTCVCAGTHTGYDCSLAVAEVIVGCTTLTCANSGTCYTTGGVEKCYCPKDYFGETCSINRVAGGFNCRNQNSDCSGQGTCSGTTGFCDCTDYNAFRGFDCSLDVSKVTTASPCDTEDCGGHGTCYDESGVATCYCDYYYTTVTTGCDTPRIPEQVTCGAEDMQMQIIPYMLGGTVYVMTDQAKTSACTVTIATGVADVLIKYNNADCGTTNAVNTDDASATDYTNDIIIQYTANMATNFDERITVVCTLSDTDQQIHSATNVNNNNAGYINSDRSFLSVPPLGSRFVDSSGNEVSVTNAFYIGDELWLEISLSDTSVYSKIKVDTATIDDGVPTLSTDVVTGGCKLIASTAIFIGMTRASDSSITLKFRTFKYQNSNVLRITASINLCRTGFMAACSDSTCSAPTQVGPGVGRKKRAADDDDDDSRVIERKITVSDGIRSATDQLAMDEKQNQSAICSMAMETIATFAVLGLFVFALSMLTIGLTCWIIKLRGRKNDDTHSLKI